MIFTVDIGNSNICFSLFQDREKEPLFLERIHTDLQKTEGEYSIDIETIFELYGFHPLDIDRCILSSVVIPLLPVMERTLRSVLSCEVITLNADTVLPFKKNVDAPETVGTDILADIRGALLYGKKPLITIDMGTATVLSAVSSAPALEGVFILPGVRTALNSLSETTSLPAISLGEPKSVVAQNTTSSLRSGIVYGTAGMIDGLIDQIETIIGKPELIVATGGLSSYIIPYCEHEILLDPTLLVKGLREIAAEK